MTMWDLRRAFAKDAARRAARHMARALSDLKSVAETAHDHRFDQVVLDLDLLKHQVEDAYRATTEENRP